MSSMTDIVFLLLIFFMLTSTLVSPNALKLLLPQSSAKTLEKQTLSVSITPDFQYYVGNQRVDVANLESILREKLANEAEPAVILHVDKSVPIEYAVKVMDVANRMKVKLVLATKPE